MTMIVRTWHGRASTAKAPAYAEHFRRNLLPELRKIKGFLGASLLRQERADEVEFFALTRWTSLESIRAFAGDDIQKAIVEPEGVAALIDFDPTVRHYEVVEEVSNSG
jgi:heme-degrading monooxygenase HmoA